MGKNIVAVVGGCLLNLFMNRVFGPALSLELALLVWIVPILGMIAHAFFLSKAKYRRRKVWMPLMLFAFPTYFLILVIEPSKRVSEILREQAQ